MRNSISAHSVFECRNLQLKLQKRRKKVKLCIKMQIIQKIAQFFINLHTNLHNVAEFRIRWDIRYDPFPVLRNPSITTKFASDVPLQKHTLPPPPPPNRQNGEYYIATFYFADLCTYIISALGRMRVRQNGMWS